MNDIRINAMKFGKGLILYFGFVVFFFIGIQDARGVVVCFPHNADISVVVKNDGRETKKEVEGVNQERKNKKGFFKKMKERVAHRILKKINKSKNPARTKRLLILLLVFSFLLVGILMIVGAIGFAGSVYVGSGLLVLAAGLLTYYALQNKGKPRE